MLNLRASVLIALLAILSMYLVERFGFAIAHSASLFGLAAAISPGILLAFFGRAGGEWFLAILAVGLNFLYYSGIALLMRRFLFSHQGARHSSRRRD